MVGLTNPRLQAATEADRQYHPHIYLKMKVVSLATFLLLALSVEKAKAFPKAWAACIVAKCAYSGITGNMHACPWAVSYCSFLAWCFDDNTTVNGQSGEKPVHALQKGEFIKTIGEDDKPIWTKVSDICKYQNCLH